MNVAWDGLVHAFVLDTLVAERARHHCVGTQLIVEATDGARSAGCEWLHADFDHDHDLDRFFVEARRFRPTRAGLIKLR